MIFAGPTWVGEGNSPSTPSRPRSGGRPSRQAEPVLPIGVQEQGRRQCSTRWSTNLTSAAGNRPLEGTPRYGGETVEVPGRRGKSRVRARVHDRHRPAPGQAHVREDLLRRAGERRGPERHQGPEGADRQDYQMHANKREERHARRGGGDIIASRVEAETRATPGPDPQKPIILESMTFPDSHLRGARGRRREATRRAGHRHPRARRGGPTSRSVPDDETGQTIIAAKLGGELHMEDPEETGCAASSRSRRNVGKPQGAYSETIKAEGTARIRTKRSRRAVRRRTAKVADQARAARDDRDRRVTSSSTRSTVGKHPREFIQSVEAGDRRPLQYGVLAGYPDGGAEGLKLTLLAVATRGRPSEMALQVRRLEG